jgi:glycosyltransferase involved in cell wall biosynthesis
MKIYQMLHFPLRGAGTGIFVDNLTKYLIKRGNEIKVLCCDHYLPRKEYPVEAVLFSNGKNQTFDLDFDFPVFASHPLSQGSTFGELSRAQFQAYLQVLRNKIRKEILVFKPDIIHVYHGWVIAYILAEFDVPYIVSLHGTEYHAFKRYDSYQKLASQGICGARLIIALTDEEKKQAIHAYGIDPQKVVIIPLAVNTDVFKPLEFDRETVLKNFSMEAANRPIVFFGGRLTAQKGVAILIKAAEIYSQHDPKPLTLIAGDGDLREELIQLTREFKLDSVHFIGNLDQQQMVMLYNVADIVVIPSIFEPLPLSAMEALACGTPVAASNIGGLRQIINSEVGFLVEPGDYRGFAEKIALAIKNTFKGKVREKAVARIRQNYDFETIAADIEKIYQGLKTVNPQSFSDR